MPECKKIIQSPLIFNIDAFEIDNIQ